MCLKPRIPIHTPTSRRAQHPILRTNTWIMVSPSLLLSPAGDPSICSISNPDFVIYSSVVSFYVPFGVTVLVYARIYMVLRQRRRKRILTRQNSQCISIRPGFPQQVSTWQELADSTPAPSFQSHAHPCRWGQDQHIGDRFTSPSTQLALQCLTGRRANIESIPGLPRSPLRGKLMAYFLDCSTSLCGSKAFHSSSSDVLQGLMVLNWDGGRVAFHCTVPCTVCPGLIFSPETTRFRDCPLGLVFLVCPCVKALSSWWVFLDSTKDV